ncbi:MAG TPA: alpha-E domain-containing protein [Acidimicrobiia bacterium]|nr:alpha-E domain-containing protein [Acidimicrobiia bacterium]
MLSRIAEALFWIGRYVERADDTARILDVHYHLLLEDPWIDEEAACRALLEVMGAVDGVAAPTGRTVNEILAYDESSPSSIAGAVHHARENARGVREAISSEMWECLNATWLALRERRSPSAGANPSLFFRFVKERAAIFVGVTDGTMSRDESWRFLTLGRALERIDMTCRLLSARWADAAGSAGWVTTLRCCSAHEAYLRTYRRAVDVSLAAQFLLLDRHFPRSVYYTLDLAERRLAELTLRGTPGGLHDDARRLVGRARTGLEFRPIDELLDDLPTVLAEVQSAGSAASAVVTARFFGSTSPLVWSA